MLPQPPGLRLLAALARAKVWPLEGDHSIKSMKVARDRPLTQEKGETGPPPEGLGKGPPPEDLRSHEEGLPVKTQWMTSWDSCPQAGEGT